MKELDPTERKAITLSCVVQRDNFRELERIAEVAVRWGVRINFSTYTWLRVDDRSYMLTKAELPEFEKIVERLLEFRSRHRNVFATEYVFDRMKEFFGNGGIPNCQAGEKFMIVNPDGALSPCGLILKKYASQKELIEGFTRTNTCGDCNTSIRANSEKPLKKLVVESLRAL
jgi:MoaA/NifB/PqqE/SkfB family radical SAM enzyme